MRVCCLFSQAFISSFSRRLMGGDLFMLLTELTAKSSSVKSRDATLNTYFK